MPQRHRPHAPHRAVRWIWPFLLLWLAGMFTAPLCAQPLYERIDAVLAAAQTGPVSPPADDAEFLRRVYLDLVGRIPSVDEARSFLADTDPNKRAALIDRLLDSPEFPRNLQERLHIMLMERQGEHPEWQAYLQRSFEQNKPWDQLVREILDPNPNDEAARGAAFFFSKRLENYGQNPVDYPGLVRDLGRLFLGIDVQCAECHDHLFIDDYKQADFHGLLAFVGQTYRRTDVQFPAIAERLLTGKLDFMSVFEKVPMQTAPRLPGGPEFEIVTFPKGEEFVLGPDGKPTKPPVPKFRPLSLLAENLPRAENRLFVRNTANRLWFLLMGRGLVHPLDLHHSDNPPAYPEVLDLLGGELVACQFNLKHMLGQLARTQAYQRSSLLPEGVAHMPPERFATALEKPLSAEQLCWSVLEATGQRAAVLAAPTEEGKPSRAEALLTRFRAAFANPPKEPEIKFAPTVKGALFVLNDDEVLGWLRPADGNLVARLAALEDPAQLAQELYLAVLSRPATPEEVQEVTSYLGDATDRRVERIGHLAWALLASAEFSVNH